MKGKWIVLVVLLVALMAIPSAAQSTTFEPSIDTAKINSYTTLYRIRDGDVTLYYVESFRGVALWGNYTPNRYVLTEIE